MAKRYVLFIAEADISQQELDELRSTAERRHPGDKVIEVRGNPRAVIVKTTNELAPMVRGPGQGALLGRNRLTAVSTSGAVGNLKRRAAEAVANGQVHE